MNWDKCKDGYQTSTKNQNGPFLKMRRIKFNSGEEQFALATVVREKKKKKRGGNYLELPNS